MGDVGLRPGVRNPGRAPRAHLRHVPARRVGVPGGRRAGAGDRLGGRQVAWRGTVGRFPGGHRLGVPPRAEFSLVVRVKEVKRGLNGTYGTPASFDTRGAIMIVIAGSWWTFVLRGILAILFGLMT